MDKIKQKLKQDIKVYRSISKEYSDKLKIAEQLLKEYNKR